MQNLIVSLRTKLVMKQFETVFTQMGQKIDNLVQQYNKTQEEQETVNIQVAKQLGFLVDNMKKFLKLTTPQTTNPHLPSQGEGQSWWASQVTKQHPINHTHPTATKKKNNKTKQTNSQTSATTVYPLVFH